MLNIYIEVEIYFQSIRWVINDSIQPYTYTYNIETIKFINYKQY